MNDERDEQAVAAAESEFAGWLREGKLPGIKAGVQQRSVRTAYALVESGFALLKERAFDALSIEEICAAAGATQGAFYGRFEDKQSFFAALQRVTCLRSEAALARFEARARAEEPDLPRLCALAVELTVERYRSNIGIFRAALQHAGEGAWVPFRELGNSYRRVLTELLSPHLPHVAPADRPLRIQFAYQVLVGTLVHATLNDPGPVHLHDQALVTELTDMLVGYLSRTAPAGAAKQRKGASG
jgi:AcrR family transcriptional regulator